MLIGPASHLPKEITEALSAIQHADPTAIVAGGCIRDTILGKPYKDIDIYVGPEFDLTKLPKGWVGSMATSAEHITQYSDFYGERMNAVFSVTTACPASDDPFAFLDHVGPDVQVIRWNTPIDPTTLIGEFDMGFCQAWSDGGWVYAGLEFHHDQLRNTATCLLSKNDPRLPHSRLRASRLQERYPDRTFLYPL